ncbi:ABC-2 type transport system permease protein [Epilithonimonas bovis DSM 19482]|uniref:ABC-2 type transport system permease protein n=1 Tax=Epilithonimonas bovis DSM 19482 TaxID=1121284 RepID=A0A1U7PZJ8_9FLAO|nr:ABC transporter permease [Epilithonimonas bovis]MDN5626877.1 ABC transporter permease [Weeksellaceae bacterium]SIT97482.1 ABC-2 type transport system permease protein [Epilithonimonas bovis DSM 19482]
MKTISQIIIREWKRIFSIPNFYVVLLVIPPVIFFFYGLIYQKQFAKELPMAVWDEDQSSVSRTLTDMMEQNDNIHFTHTAFSNAEIEKLMKEGKIFGAVHFPKNMESDAKKNHQSNITLYTNGAYLVPAKMIYKGAAEIIIKGGLAVVLEKAEKQGMPAQTANALVQPIKLNSTILYNPDFNYKMYLTPGLITVGLQMALIVAAVLILNLEFKRNTIDDLLEISHSSSQIVIGKMLAHLSVSWILFVLVAFVVFPVYDLEKPGTDFNFFIIYTLMALACIGIGMMLSALSDNLLFVTDVALFFTSPAFVFSGFTFPRWAMPWYDQLYSDIMPYTHFLDGFIKLYFMQLPMHYAMPEVYKLLLFTGVTFPLAVIIFQRKINLYLKNQH